MSESHAEALLETLKKAAATLRSAQVPFALAGGCGAYAWGAAPPVHDVDFVLREEDLGTARTALTDAGLRMVDPPEGWLIKAYDGDQLVDLIFRPSGRRVDSQLLDRAEQASIAAMTIPVLSATDLVIMRLLAYSETSCDFSDYLPTVRALREQVDWDQVIKETATSPYAYAFLTLLNRLDVIDRKPE